MDFFEAQDNARKKTWQLALLFGAAVILLITMTNVLIAGAYLLASGGSGALPGNGFMDVLANIPFEIWMWSSLGVITLVSLASGYKYMMIRGGGRAVAESLGGMRVQSNTGDLKSRRLLNVVEEMAIAAGVSVPPVYLIDEPGINAFAAGYTPDDAVLGVTQGAIDYLNREELQGVIGHEFSHILNGDTRLNIRLIAILFGIVFIGLIGNMMLRGTRHTRHGIGRSRGEGSGAGVAAILALGAGLAVIGYAGTFFGNLIKAAVSRQREYLADAASVQYTRNPKGLSGALIKLGSAGSKLHNNGANEISHMFFGQAISHFLGGIMATHPPLPTRISAIDPGWNGSFPADLIPQSLTRLGDTASGFAVDPGGSQAVVEGVAVDVESLPEVVGRPDDRSYRAADAIIESTDSLCLSAARDPCEAHLLIFSLLLHQGEALSGAGTKTGTQAASKQAQIVAQLNDGEQTVIAKLQKELQEEDDLHRLALLELAVPALKQMSHPQYKEFIGQVIALIRADRRIELFEWVLHRLLLKELSPHFERPRTPKVRFKSVAQVTDEAATLVATLAHYGHESTAEVDAAYTQAIEELQLERQVKQPTVNKDDNFAALNEALKKLRDLAPLQKPKLLKACARSVLFDGHISAEEGALLQGISAALDCPLPPSVVAKSQATGPAHPTRE